MLKRGGNKNTQPSTQSNSDGEQASSSGLRRSKRLRGGSEDDHPSTPQEELPSSSSAYISPSSRGLISKREASFGTDESTDFLSNFCPAASKDGVGELGASKSASSAPNSSSEEDNTVQYSKIAVHSRYCSEQAEDFYKMTRRIKFVQKSDPEYIDKPLKLPIFTYHPNFGYFGDIKMLHPLHHASALGHNKCVKMLLDAGAKPDIVTREGYNAIHYAIYHGYRGNNEKHYNLVKTLVDKNVMPLVLSPLSYYNKTYLIDNCIDRNNMKLLRLLLENGIPAEELIKERNGDIFAPNYNETPLIRSLKHRNLDAFQLLLFHGASLAWYPRSQAPDERHLIPHYILIDYKVNLIVRAMNIYKQFGGNMWLCDNRLSELEGLFLYNFITTKPKLMEKLGSIVTELEDMICNPLSLQNLSRIAIRNAMGRNYWSNIDSLPLPNDLKNFLKFLELLVHQC